MPETRLITITNSETRDRALEAVRTAPEGYRVKIQPPGRSLAQNDFSHEIYAIIARQLPEDDALGWKCYCKLHHGVPILRAEDAEFKEAYDNGIKGLTYEQKLGAMRILPVTSRMTKDQKSRYIEAVMDDFLTRGVKFNG